MPDLIQAQGCPLHSGPTPSGHPDHSAPRFHGTQPFLLHWKTPRLMALGLPSVLPLWALCFLSGASVSWAAVRWVLCVRRRGRVCPRCSSTTLSLVPGFPLKLLGRGVTSRWCPGCGWKGLALRPAHERRNLIGKIRLRGGFRWGPGQPGLPGVFSWREARPNRGVFPARPDVWETSRKRSEAGRRAPEPLSSSAESDPDFGDQGRMGDTPPPRRPQLGFRWRL